MDTLRIKRLRSLSDTGNIGIRPVTILLGRNSSGKSTFLRTFPLFKQSVEARTTGPVLWYGRLVDFGSFEDAHQYNSEEGIEFEFGFRVDQDDFSRVHDPYRRRRLVGSIDVNLSIKLVEDRRKEITRTKELQIQVADSTIHLKFNQEDDSVSEFRINELDILDPKKVTYIASRAISF